MRLDRRERIRLRVCATLLHTTNGRARLVLVQTPDIRYARSGDVAIAYAVLGDGPIDLVAVHGFAGNLDFELESPYWRPFHDRLASFSRHVMFDRRGTGLSDRMREAPTLETRMDDLRAVLDAIGSESAVLFGTFEAASMCLLFAATYPERTRGLVLYNPVAKGTAAPDYPWAQPLDEGLGTGLDEVIASWGTADEVVEWARVMVPSLADDAEFIRTIARNRRLGASPGAALTIRRMAADVDVRDVLSLECRFARSEGAWLTFGFDLHLGLAARIAVEGMLVLMEREHGLSRPDALGLASIVVDLRVTQVVNQVLGVHAVLRDDAFL